MYVFDCEVFKYDWLFVFKKVGTDNYDVIINDTNKLNQFYENNKDKLFIGFNNRAYDNLIFCLVPTGAFLLITILCSVAFSSNVTE